ncbi:hypothetical protein Tco_0452701 [Tanacetum coccineum]
MIANPVPITPGINGAQSTRSERVMETYATILEEIKKKIYIEAEAVQIILTGIDNDIYSIVDACPDAMEMWKEMERLKQGESINVHDLQTNMFLEFWKFTSWDGETLDSYYSRFYKIMIELHVSYHKLYDFLKQHQNEVNEIRAERLARNVNPLALVAATQQPIYHPQPKPTHYTQSSSTRSQDATRNKGKEIANTPSPKYDSEPKAVSNEEATPKYKEIEKLMALILIPFKKIYKPTNNNLKTSSNTRNKNVDNTSRFDRRISWLQLSAEQVDWRDDTDDEPKDQELEAHYMYMAKIQEVIPNAVDNSGPIFDIEPLAKLQNNNDNNNVFAIENEHPKQLVMEKDDINITLDSSDMSDHRREADQDDDLAKERDLLAS